MMVVDVGVCVVKVRHTVETIIRLFVTSDEGVFHCTIPPIKLLYNLTKAFLFTSINMSNSVSQFLVTQG